MENMEKIYEKVVKGRNISTDSRNIKAGDVFFALKGENFDGNAYVRKALEAGAFAALTDSRANRRISGAIFVPDVLECLQRTANFHRLRLGVPVIGITGTNGKTTTKELCREVLSRKFRITATEGNFNNHIGLPLSLLKMNEDTEMGIVEMGTSHPGEIEALCRIASPDFGIITNIGEAHLEGFGSKENIVTEKTSLYKYIGNKNGNLFVNADDPLLMELSEGCRRTTYGCNSEEIRGEIVRCAPFLEYELHTPDKIRINTELVGGYNFHNAMAASALGIYFGIAPEDIRRAVERYRPGNMRSQLIRKGETAIILDAYNANPSSMQKAVDTMNGISGVPKGAILGEMLELGRYSEKAHTDLIRKLEVSEFDWVVLIGKAFEKLPKPGEHFLYFEDLESAGKYLKTRNLSGYTVLVKGSRRNKLEGIIEFI